MLNKNHTRSATVLTRRTALGLMLGGVAGAAMAQSVPSVDRSPFPKARPKGLHKRAVPSGADLVAQAGVSGTVSYAVATLHGETAGEVLETRGPVLRMPPASVAKVTTSIYALEHLGPDFTFQTKVIAAGPVVDGKIVGDLILQGSGDPTLDTDMLGDLAGQLAAQGITGITGGFYVDGTALPRIEIIDNEQTEYAGYNPTITGLNVNYNRVHFEWKKQGDGFALKMDARAKRFAPDVKIASMTIADRGLPVFDHVAGQGRDDWSVARSALGNGGARWLPVRLPVLYAGEVFAAVAQAQGVLLPKAQPIVARGDSAAPLMEIARHDSAALSDLVRNMLKYSTNLTAEILGLAASRARGLDPKDLKSSAQAMSAWAQTRLGTRHLAFVDHSGLGGASVVSTTDMVRLLSARGVETLIGPLLKPIAPRDAGYEVIKTPSFGIDAKTGTLDFVSTLAGYITAPDGTRLAFASFAADVPARIQAKALGLEVPRGARTFNARAKRLHQALIGRWAVVYGS
jgi:D-alanyl-D-alanine carboxypeptidase/D-alanyl-D-alanine-endopeptidase (penicillin-binding protein 4)